MVKRWYTYGYLCMLLLCCFSVQGQKQLLTEVSIEKPSVYLGEPLEVSVSVYTATWFTKGVSPGNVKVNGAFTVYFRSLSTSKEVNGQLYSGVKLFFNVFPYEASDLVFPSLEFIVETPDIGDYKGKKRKVKTRERSIKVKDVPNGIEKGKWLVSNSVAVYDSWKGDIKDVKVGDVLERTIRQKVGGTVSEFIPEIPWDAIENVSIYPKRPKLKNNQTKTSIGASRTDRAQYLFEKEGTVVIPEVVVHWWHPRHKKLYKKTLKAITVEVAPNPNLELLETVKAALDNDEATDEPSKTPLLILGMEPKKFAVLLLSCLFSLYVLIYTGAKIVKRYRAYRKAYKASEVYFFRMFVKSYRKRNSQDTVRNCYRWLDSLGLKTPTIHYFLKQYGAVGVQKQIADTKDLNNYKLIVFISLKEWRAARESFITATRKSFKNTSNWLNP